MSPVWSWLLVGLFGPSILVGVLLAGCALLDGRVYACRASRPTPLPERPRYVEAHRAPSGLIVVDCDCGARLASVETMAMALLEAEHHDRMFHTRRVAS